MFRKWGLFYIALLLGAVFAFLAITPPPPKSADVPADEFSAERAMVDVRVIAAEPHVTGTEANAKVRAYLKERLTELDLEVSESRSMIEGRPLERLNTWKGEGEGKTEQEIVNIIGVRPGTDRSKPALLLMAHHDTVWGSPGAADDTAGVASILEIVRALNTTGPHDRDLIVLFTDAEEVGLSGARYFFSEHPLKERVGAIINFEARGGGGTANMFQTSANNGDLARLYAKSAREPSASSLSVFVYNALPNDTDLTPALDGDYVAYNIANIGGAEYYHSPKIDADALSEATLQHMGSQGLDLVRALLSADAFPTRKADATFFDLFGLITIIYAAYWGWVFLALAVVFYVLSVRANLSRKSIGVGAAKMLGYLIGGGLVLHGLNWLAGTNRGFEFYYDGLAAISMLEAVAFFFSAALFLSVLGRRRFSENERFGAALPLLVIGVLGQAFAPTATYFISLPLLLCALSSFVWARWPGSKGSAALVVILSALMVGYMVSLGHLLMLGVGPDLLAVAILPAAMLALAIFPLYQNFDDKRPKIMAGAGFVLAIGLTLWIRFDPVASTVPLY